MKAKIKLKIKYEGPITFFKEGIYDYNAPSLTKLDYELKVFLFNIKILNQSIDHWGSL